MIHLCNIGAMPLNSYFKEQVSKLNPELGTSDQLYYHFLFEPGTLESNRFCMENQDYILCYDNDDVIILRRIKEYEYDNKTFLQKEYCIVFNKMGIMFYNDFNEKHNRKSYSVMLAVEEYLNGGNQEDGWLC